MFTDKSGCTHFLEHDIRLSNEIPFRTISNPIPYHMTDTIHAEVNKMLELGVIEVSDTPYSSPIVICQKKVGKIVFV